MSGADEAGAEALTPRSSQAPLIVLVLLPPLRVVAEAGVRDEQPIVLHAASS